MKTILEIDLSTASFPVGTALLKFCADHALSYSLHGGEPVAPRMMPAEKAPAPKAAPKRKAKPAKRVKAPAAAPAPVAPKTRRAKRVAKPAAKPGEPAPKCDRSVSVSPEEQAKVIAILRAKDMGAGVMTEDVYTGLGGKTRHWQSLVATLRANGTIRDNGGSKRGLRLFAPKDAAETAEHPTTGQTLTRKPRVRVRDAVTKEQKREYDFDMPPEQEQ